MSENLVWNSLYHKDCIQGLTLLEPESVDLVFADPPFNIGYDYDIYDDAQSVETYLNWCREWISGVYKTLKPDGTFWLAIGDEYAAELKILAQSLGFHCRSWVIWYYTFGVNCSKKFTRSHTHLFYFVKDKKRFTFLDHDLENRVPSARQLVYNDRRANPTGRLPDDTWILRPQDLAEQFTADENTWYFPRVAGTFKERAGFHGCQMPEQLLGRIVRICSHPGELVLDPFSGSATTLAVAKKLNRQYLGFDLSAEYVRLGTERLQRIQPGDPLDGAPEPTMSSPSTWNGKPLGSRPARRKKSLKSRQRQQAKLKKVKAPTNRKNTASQDAVNSQTLVESAISSPAPVSETVSTATVKKLKNRSARTDLKQTVAARRVAKKESSTTGQEVGSAPLESASRKPSKRLPKQTDSVKKVSRPRQSTKADSPKSVEQKRPTTKLAQAKQVDKKRAVKTVPDKKLPDMKVADKKPTRKKPTAKQLTVQQEKEQNATVRKSLPKSKQSSADSDLQSVNATPDNKRNSKQSVTLKKARKAGK